MLMGALNPSRIVSLQLQNDGIRIAGCFVDSSLLLLLVAGRTGKDVIAKHRRLRQFSAEDYTFLLGLLDGVKQVFVTPHTLTETSNLLTQHREPERSRLFVQLQHLIHESKEVTVAGTDASIHTAFKRLGLTDAALLEVAREETPLLTVDLDLYLEAVKRDPNSAFNFTFLRGF